MFNHLHISDPGERWLVGLADVALRAALGVTRLIPRRTAPAPARILLLRLERIGDLLMTLDAIAAVRANAPRAEIDLIVGSWNAPIARMVPGIDLIETLDAPWLARDTMAQSVPSLVARALAWRRRRYDLALNFEGDIRSHCLMALSGAPRRVGFDVGGRGPLLTDIVDRPATHHTGQNALRLVDRAFGASTPTPGGPPFTLTVPDDVRRQATSLLGGGSSPRRPGRSPASPDPRRPLVGVHAGSGREIKQWRPGSFAEVATRLARDASATIVLTGSAEDRPVVEALRKELPPEVPVINVVGQANLAVLAGILERLSLLVTGDTGPMHLAAAVGTPVVGVFGPSDPARYAPRATLAHVVRADLPCSPCNRIRRPPQRCVGRVPDCLRAVEPDQMYRAALALLHAAGSAAAPRPTEPGIAHARR